MADPKTMSVDLHKARRERLVSHGHHDWLLPHSVEAEQGVLGCVLLSPKDCLPECMLRFKGAEAFYDLRHQTVYQALCALAEAGTPPDIITVQQYLKDKNILEQVGGVAYLCQLQDAPPSAANLSYYLGIVQEKLMLRKIIHTCTEFAGRAFDCDEKVEVLLDAFERDSLAVRTGRKDGDDIKELVRKAVDVIERKATSWDTITGLSTGLSDLDHLSDGLHAGELVAITGYPSTGKTALMVNIAVHNALAGVPVAILTAEMRPVQLVVRSLCSEAKANFRRISGNDVPKFMTPISRLSKAPLYIESINGFTIGQVEALARRLVQRHGVKLFAVDYLQLIEGEGDTEAQRLTAVSHGTKRIALEHDATVLVGSQLNDDGKILGSRTLSQDGDSVWKLKNVGEWEPLVQAVELLVDKSRDGETGKVDLTFLKSYTRFEVAAKVTQEDEPDDRSVR